MTDEKGKITVHVHITRRDAKTLFKLKRMAMSHGGFPLSMSPQRHEADLQKSGNCMFLFPSREKADKFKNDVVGHISHSRARISEY
jgi:hypothetical protein